MPTASALGIAEMLPTAVRAVAEACALTRRVQANLESIRSMTKNDRSPVSVADFAAQAVVNRRLADAFGEFNMVGEEDAKALRLPDRKDLRAALHEAIVETWSDANEDAILDAIDLGNHDATAGVYWTLDPVDGTKGFLRGEQYAVSLALIEGGRVVLGVLGCPNLSADLDRPFDDPDPHGLIFYAMSDGPCHAVPADEPDAPPRIVETVEAGEDVPVGPGSGEAPIRVCESVEAGHSKHSATEEIIERLGGGREPARLDSQCKYAVVARGQADAYLRLPTKRGYVEKIWDHAAGMLVAERAGAIVTDVTGDPLDFSHGTSLRENLGLVCAAPRYHARLVAAIRELGYDRPPSG